MSASERAYIVRGSFVYHTDEECRKLQQANDYRQVDASGMSNLRECQTCKHGW